MIPKMIIKIVGLLLIFVIPVVFGFMIIISQMTNLTEAGISGIMKSIIVPINLASKEVSTESRTSYGTGEINFPEKFIMFQIYGSDKPVSTSQVTLEQIFLNKEQPPPYSCIDVLQNFYDNKLYQKSQRENYAETCKGVFCVCFAKFKQKPEDIGFFVDSNDLTKGLYILDLSDVNVEMKANNYVSSITFNKPSPYNEDYFNTIKDASNKFCVEFLGVNDDGYNSADVFEYIACSPITTFMTYESNSGTHSMPVFLSGKSYSEFNEEFINQYDNLLLWVYKENGINVRRFNFDRIKDTPNIAMTLGSV